MATPNVPIDFTMLHYIAAGAAGLVIGAGVMIIALARWGRKILGIEALTVVEKECPYAKDHPTLQTFMGESINDRKNLREFLEEINVKINNTSQIVSNTEGKLDVLLRGAMVRWNSGLILDEKK